LALDWSGDFQLEATETRAGIADASLRLPDDSEPAVALRRLGAEAATISLAKRQVRIGEVSLAGARIDLLRDKAGRLNLSRIARQADGDTAQAAAPPGTPPGAGSDAARASPAAAAADAGEAGADAAWSVQVERVALEDNAVRFRDLGAERPVELPLTQIAGTIGKVGSDLSVESPVDLRARIASAGSLALRGTLVPAPLAAKLAVTLQRFPLPAVDPYVARFLTLGLDAGTAGTQGELQL